MTHDDDIFDSEQERLLTRLVDGEASADDRSQFEQIAAGEPTLWRTLAERQEDALMLRDGFERATANALEVNLPQTTARGSRLSLPLTFSGWAAGIILAAAWIISAVNTPTPAPVETIIDESTRVERLSPEEGFNRYLDAPWVIDELPPVVHDWEELPDGRVAITYFRRIQEVAFLAPEAELPINEMNELTAPPADLHPSTDELGDSAGGGA